MPESNSCALLIYVPGLKLLKESTFYNLRPVRSPSAQIHPMQASTSRAGLAQLTRSLAVSNFPPPCTCGVVLSARKSSTWAADQSSRPAMQSSVSPSTRSRPRTPYTGRSQAEKLAAREERTHVVFEGLSPWVTPNDVRRLIAQRLGNSNDVKEGQAKPSLHPLMG